MSNENNDKNGKRPIIQSSGYNGSGPTRICPKCGQEKLITDFGFRNMGTEIFEINHGAKNADNKDVMYGIWNGIVNIYFPVMV